MSHVDNLGEERSRPQELQMQRWHVPGVFKDQQKSEAEAE